MLRPQKCHLVIKEVDIKESRPRKEIQRNHSGGFLLRSISGNNQNLLESL